MFLNIAYTYSKIKEGGKLVKTCPLEISKVPITSSDSRRNSKLTTHTTVSCLDLAKSRDPDWRITYYWACKNKSSLVQT